MRALGLLILGVLVLAGCGQRAAPLMPDHLGSGANESDSTGPRALLASLQPTTGLDIEGALVALPDDGGVVFGGAIDRLPTGRYRVATASAEGCTNPVPNLTVGEFEASDFGQGKFSLAGPDSESVSSLNEQTVIVQGPLAGGTDAGSTVPAVVACGVLEVYTG